MNRNKYVREELHEKKDMREAKMETEDGGEEEDASKDSVDAAGDAGGGHSHYYQARQNQIASTGAIEP